MQHYLYTFEAYTISGVINGKQIIFMGVRKLDNIWSELQLITIVKVISSISSNVKTIIDQISKNHLSKVT